MTTSCRAERRSVSRRICNAVVTGITLTPSGAGKDTGPQTTVTRAPRLFAAVASAKPIAPEDALLR